MGTGYTRNDTGNNIADGNVINAADFDGEFDAIVSAFATDGHTHDGTAAEGGPIQKLGPSQEVEVDSGAIFPASDGVTDLGKTTKEWKDLYIDGVINTDNMSADAATITGNASVGGTFNVGGATTLTGTASLSSAFAVSATSAFKGAVSVESTLAVTGETNVSDISASGTLDVAGETSLGNISADGTLDVSGNGSVGGTFKITGAVTAASTLNIGGAVSGKGTLTVSDTVSAAGAMNVGGNFSGKGTLTVTDAVSVASTLNVGGNFSGKGTFNVAGSATLSGNVTMGDATADTTSINSQVEFKNNLRERTSISTTSATGTINFDILSHNVELRTNDAAANFELNLRGDSSTAFSATVAVGQTTSVAFESSMGSTAYYLTAIKIDGATASPVHWQGGTTAPSEGNADGIDSYLINVTRSADAGSGTAQYTCLASQTQYGKVTY